jgi:hypothetical protein
MTREEVERFHANMARKMRGDFTPLERERYAKRTEVYQTILQRNGGKNPLFRF